MSWNPVSATVYLNYRSNRSSESLTAQTQSRGVQQVSKGHFKQVLMEPKPPA